MGVRDRKKDRKLRWRDCTNQSERQTDRNLRGRGSTNKSVRQTDRKGRGGVVAIRVRDR